MPLLSARETTIAQRRLRTPPPVAQRIAGHQERLAKLEERFAQKERNLKDHVFHLREQIRRLERKNLELENYSRSADKEARRPSSLLPPF